MSFDGGHGLSPKRTSEEAPLRAARINAERTLDVVDVDRPSVGADEVLLDVEYCGICGSDLHMLRMPEEHVPAGHVLGHEFTGVIAELGARVDGWAVGERVVVFPMIACGGCRTCGAGHPNLCEQGSEHGIENGPGLGRPGAYAESVAVPQAMLRRLPPSVSDIDGALIEPLAVAIRAVKISQVGPEEAVCVLGAGPIGILAVAALKARGCHRVAVVEQSAIRRAAVERLGVSAVAPAHAPESVPTLLGEPPAAAIDCTGHQSAAPLAIELLAPAGRLTVVGLPDEPAAIDLATLARYELTVRGSVVYSEEDFADAIEDLAGSRIPTDQIITRIASLDAAPVVIAELASGATDHVKVLLRPR
jgi:(R,R)-butanediol dehydrogenase/meso-butanediol dehydrogenase/diacetyl reductase